MYLILLSVDNYYLSVDVHTENYTIITVLFSILSYPYVDSLGQHLDFRKKLCRLLPANIW